MAKKRKINKKESKKEVKNLVNVTPRRTSKALVYFIAFALGALVFYYLSKIDTIAGFGNFSYFMSLASAFVSIAFLILLIVTSLSKIIRK